MWSSNLVLVPKPGGMNIGISAFDLKADKSLTSDVKIFRLTQDLRQLNSLTKRLGKKEEYKDSNYATPDQLMQLVNNKFKNL